MQAIENFNEVTMHALEIVYTHMFNTKGPLPGKGSVGGGAAVAQPMHVSVGFVLSFLKLKKALDGTVCFSVYGRRS